MEGHHNETSTPRTETVKTPEGGEVSFSPERGGIITSIQLHGKEILYMDHGTFNNPGGSVRGGIPILFPNAGPIESEKFPNLKQHGFARDASSWKVEKNARGFKETLFSNAETKAVYPYNFRFSTAGILEEDGSFVLNQEVENMETDTEMPLSMGLHPYFKVPQNQKNAIKFNFPGGESIEKQSESWMNGAYVSVDNPRTENTSPGLEIIIPDLGTLTIQPSPEYKKIWVWSLPGKDFVCIEPVMRGKNGLVEDPQKISPGEIFSASVRIGLRA